MPPWQSLSLDLGKLKAHSKVVQSVVNSKKGERYATQKIPAGGAGFEFFVNRPRDLELLDPQSKQGTLNMNPTIA
jgi:hypothetical protein